MFNIYVQTRKSDFLLVFFNFLTVVIYLIECTISTAPGVAIEKA